MKAWQDLVGGELTPAEAALIEACLAGRGCIIGEDRPDAPSEDREIRAPILKALITGGLPDQPTTDVGVHLEGAYVSGPLDLSLCRATGLTGLLNCRFEHGLEAMQAQFEFLNLSGSYLPKLNAQGARVAGSVFLSGGFHATGEVSLSGAEIGGLLCCAGGRFENAKGHALKAQGARIKNGVFLTDDFYANGMVLFSGAQIEGQLDCSSARFNNEAGFSFQAEGAKVDGLVDFRKAFILTGGINIAGMRISKQLIFQALCFLNDDGKGIHAQALKCDGEFVLQTSYLRKQSVNLAFAHVGTLADDPDSWPKGGRVILNGFTYDRIGDGPTDGKARLAWLARGDRLGDEFFPQPYTQLAKVLRNMGHERGARDVLVARDRKIAAEEWKRAYQSLDGTWTKAWASLGADFRGFINFFSHLFIDYGHRPLKALWSLLALWLIATTLAHFAWKAGDMVPNSDVILTSANWSAEHDADHPAMAWGETPEGASWETFNRYAWAADVVIPILDFAQTQAWTPTTARGWAGCTLWWGKWVLSAAGWIVLAFAAAGVTGVARRD